MEMRDTPRMLKDTQDRSVDSPASSSYTESPGKAILYLSHGIKVRLQIGIVGRVKEIMDA